MKASMLGRDELEIARNLPEDGCEISEAQNYTRWLATHHYENFRVVSWLLPSRLHQHFYNIYSYCRWSDDLGDEVPDAKRAIQLLDEWDAELQRAYNCEPKHPVLIAVAETARACDIPIEPFRDLLIAFRQDQIVHRYKTWDGLIEYCCHSANPVGRLVLYLMGYRDAERQALSDVTCTALQLANFWQDVARDLEKGRIYIPLGIAAEYGVKEQDIVEKKFDERFASLMKDLVSRTRALFLAGSTLANRVSAEFRVDIELFTRGGCAVLDAIEAIRYDTLHNRPAISRRTQAQLLGLAMISRVGAIFHRPTDGGSKPEEASLADRHA